MPKILRCLFLLILPILLVFAAWVVWQSAFERVPGHASIGLGSGAWPTGFEVVSGGGQVQREAKSGALRLTAMPAGEVPTVEISLATWPRGAYVHLAYDVESVGLVRGANAWQDGRVAVIWRDAAGDLLPGHLGIAGGDGVTRFQGEKIAPLDRPGRPSIIVQNLGTGGDWVVRRLTSQPVRLRAWVVPAAIGLVLATIVWLVMVFRGLTPPGLAMWRRLAAAGFFAVALWWLVLPGPWVPFLPIQENFRIGGAEPGMENPSGASGGPAATDAPAVEAGQASDPTVAGARPVPGAMESGLLLETYHWVKKQARAAMHLVAFAGITVVSMLLLGRRGWIPVGVLAMVTEAMQVLFGFAFDAQDVRDITVNGLGIEAGAFLTLRSLRWFSRRGTARR